MIRPYPLACPWLDLFLLSIYLLTDFDSWPDAVAATFSLSGVSYWKVALKLRLQMLMGGLEVGER